MVCSAEVAYACNDMHAHGFTRETTNKISNCSLIIAFNLHTLAVKQRCEICENKQNAQ